MTTTNDYDDARNFVAHEIARFPSTIIVYIYIYIGSSGWKSRFTVVGALLQREKDDGFAKNTRSFQLLSHRVRADTAVDNNILYPFVNGDRGDEIS